MPWRTHFEPFLDSWLLCRREASRVSGRNAVTENFLRRTVGYWRQLWTQEYPFSVLHSSTWYETISYYTLIPCSIVIGATGIILVHDLTNRKSEINLRKWLAEVLSKENNSSASGRNSGRTYDAIDEYDPENFIGSSQVPTIHKPTLFKYK